MKKICIDDYEIGGDKTFIIAELSANHNGDIDIAKETIRAAALAGADCIKLQTYTAETITLDVDNEFFRIKQGTVWDGRTLFDLYQEAYTPWEWHQELFDTAREAGLICFSSPFDQTAVDFLEKLNAPAYKIASFEITDIPLIEYVASKGKPIIISTGIADESDILLAVNACRKQGNEQIILLKCTSAYPAAPEDANLATIPELEKIYNVIPGLSDHTIGIAAPVVAVAMGAKVIEKHFILDKSLGGVDSHFSLDPNEFAQMVEAVRVAEKMKGEVDLQLTEKKKRSREFSRSLFVAQSMNAGDVITKENVRSVRPGFGLHPKHLPSILGKRVNQYLEKGTPFKLDFIE